MEDRSPRVDTLPGDTTEQLDVKENLQMDVAMYRFHPVPHAHFHLPNDIVVSLFRKSYYLWCLPDIPLGTPPPNDPHWVLSNDQRRLPAECTDSWPGATTLGLLESDNGSSGPWPSTLHPVRTLTAPAHIEALILLLCRDLHADYKVDFRWYCQLMCLGERRGPRQTRQARKEARYQLKPEFQPVWDKLRDHVVEAGPTENLFDPLLDLRARLKAEGKLPYLPKVLFPPENVSFRLTKAWMTEEEQKFVMESDDLVPWMYFKMIIPTDQEKRKGEGSFVF